MYKTLPCIVTETTNFLRRHVIDRWFWLGKPRPYTPNKRGRPRTWDAAGGSTEREPAPQKNLRSGGCSVAAIEEDSNRAARGGDLSGSFRRDCNDDLMTSPDDEIASNECSDPDYEDRAQNDVDDNNVDQTWGDPANQYCELLSPSTKVGYGFNLAVLRVATVQSHIIKHRHFILHSVYV